MHPSTNNEIDGPKINGQTEVPKQLKVAVLSSSYDCSESVFKDYDAEIDLRAFNPSPAKYIFDAFLIEKPTAVDRITALVHSGKYDVFLNFCDGGPGSDVAGVEVIECLESLGVPYGGANAKFYTTSKRQAKRVAEEHDVPTPRYRFIFTNGSLEPRIKDVLTHLIFPMIVKHHDGGGSLGMTEQSKVNNPEELTREVERIVGEFGGALVEEFISGREFTVLVAENPDDPNDPLVYEPFECRLKDADSFKHFRQKFIDYDSLQWLPVLDASIGDQLKSSARRVFLGCQANSYGRLDFRMCKRSGVAYFLEINPQCGVFYATKDIFGSADFILDSCNGHQQFLENLIQCAFNDFARKNSSHVKSQPSSS